MNQEEWDCKDNFKDWPLWFKLFLVSITANFILICMMNKIPACFN